jgi:hypothetical protein
VSCQMKFWPVRTFEPTTPRGCVCECVRGLARRALTRQAKGRRVPVFCFGAQSQTRAKTKERSSKKRVPKTLSHCPCLAPHARMDGSGYEPSAPMTCVFSISRGCFPTFWAQRALRLIWLPRTKGPTKNFRWPSSTAITM